MQDTLEYNKLSGDEMNNILKGQLSASMTCSNLQNLREMPRIPLDLHLMIQSPEYKVSWLGIPAFFREK